VRTQSLRELLEVEEEIPSVLPKDAGWTRTPEELMRLCIISVEEGGILPTEVGVIGGIWVLKYKAEQTTPTGGILVPYYLFYRHED